MPRALSAPESIYSPLNNKWQVFTNLSRLITDKYKKNTFFELFNDLPSLSKPTPCLDLLCLFIYFLYYYYLHSSDRQSHLHFNPPAPSESMCALELTSGESLPCFPQHDPSPSPTTMPLLDTKPMLTLSKLVHFEERRVRKKQHITISSNTQRKPIITKARG